MVFGGFDMNDNVLSTNAIINLSTYQVEIMTNSIGEPDSIPSPRAFHQIQKIGVICLLYGGKTSQLDYFNDVWNFNIIQQRWMKLNTPNTPNFDELYLYRSNYFFTTISGTERPVIYGGENRNKEGNNDLIILDYPICLTNIMIFGPDVCLPCSEGYFLNSAFKCEQCLPGTYHNFISKKSNYIQSACENCPIATSNNELASKSKNKCRICGIGYYNEKEGSSVCRKCPKDKLCLTGIVEKL